jgi:hypothetical protein
MQMQIDALIEGLIKQKFPYMRLENGGMSGA